MPCAADAAQLIAVALDAGMFRFIVGQWLKLPAFCDEALPLQRLQAQALHQLLMLFLESQPVRWAQQHHASNALCESQPVGPVTSLWQQWLNISPCGIQLTTCLIGLRFMLAGPYLPVLYTIRVMLGAF